MKHLLATTLSAFLLLGAMSASAADTTFSDEVLSLWSAAYDSDALQQSEEETWHPQDVNPRARQEDDGNAGDTGSHSLTPNLDRLLGGSSALQERQARRPTTAPRSLRHETFFENPPMTTQSKSYSGWGGSKDGRRWHRDRDRRGSGGHPGNNPTLPQQPPTPTPEPGTLFLAGSAALAALAARRRARRKAAATAAISD